MRVPRSSPIERAPTSALPTGPTRTTDAMTMMLRKEKVMLAPTSGSRTSMLSTPRTSRVMRATGSAKGLAASQAHHMLTTAARVVAAM